MVRIVLVHPGSGSPDMLTLEAWDALSRPPVLLAPGDPLGPRLAEIGIAVEEVPEAAPERLRAADAGQGERSLEGETAPGEPLKGRPLRLLAAAHAHADVPAGARVVADLLAERAQREGAVTFVVPSEVVVRAVMERALAGDVEVEVVIGRVARGHRLLDLVGVMARLRGPDGCPWDREQTHQTLVRYLIDETYEFLEAVERGTAVDIREELGDLLLQVVFHAQMAAEEGVFDVDDVADALVRKLVTRHPHVFADVEVSGAGEVVANWDLIKQHEKERASVLEGVPESLPALAYAQKLQRRARAAAPDADREARETLERVVAAPDEDALGAALFALTALARRHGLDAETALRRAAKSFRDRVIALEREAERRGVSFGDLPREELERLWQ